MYVFEYKKMWMYLIWKVYGVGVWLCEVDKREFEGYFFYVK